MTSPASSAPARPGGLPAQPGYPAFLLAATLARLATEMFPVAAVLLVLDRTGRPGLAGAVVAATTLPAVVTGPVLGAWLDRTGRRRLALASNQVLLAASLLGILAAAGRAPGWVLVLLAALAGLTGPLATGGYTSMIPLLVPERLLARANALEAASFNTAAIAGPAVAGVVAATAGPAGAVLAEAALAGLALPAIARMPRVAPPAGDHPAPLATAIRQGLAHLAHTPVLRGVTVATAVGMGGTGLLTLALPFWAERLGAGRAGAGYLWAGLVVPGRPGPGGAGRPGRGPRLRGHLRDPPALVAPVPARPDLHHRGQPQAGRVRDRLGPGRARALPGRRRRHPGRRRDHPVPGRRPRPRRRRPQLVPGARPGGLVAHLGRPGSGPGGWR